MHLSAQSRTTLASSLVEIQLFTRDNKYYPRVT